MIHVIRTAAYTPRYPGYKDSCADIAYCLSTSPPTTSTNQKISIVTPVSHPDVQKNDDYAWCFPDTEAGILDAIAKGATHLWANTILFASHPLQTSTALDEFARDVKVVGQPPLQVEMFDDKAFVNDLLRGHRSRDNGYRVHTFTMPKGWTLCDPSPNTSATASGGGTDSPNDRLREYITSLSLPYPVVGKPIRGRGSHGVKVCHSLEEMITHAAALFAESPRIMVEEYLAGDEGTVTVLPAPSSTSLQKDSENENESRKKKYTALPVVLRTNHHAGIAPYNGTVAVSENSRAVTAAEAALDRAYALVQSECVSAAELLQPTGVIRIDVRRRRRGARAAVESGDVAGQRQGEQGKEAVTAEAEEEAEEEEEEAGAVDKFCLFDINVKPVSPPRLIPYLLVTLSPLPPLEGKQAVKDKHSRSSLASAAPGEWHYPLLNLPLPPPSPPRRACSCAASIRQTPVTFRTQTQAKRQRISI